MIYVVRAMGTNLYKIGFTSRDDFEKRLSELQTSSPFDLEILLYIDGDQKDEKTIHDALSGFRQKREWFEIDTDRIFLIMFSVILGRKPKYKLLNVPSPQRKDLLKGLWTPEYFVNKYYMSDNSIEFSQHTGISLEELWLKYVEVAGQSGYEIPGKKDFVKAIDGLGVQKKTIDRKIYYQLHRKPIERS